MPNLAAVLRSEVNIVVGTKVHEYFGAPYDAWFDGKVTKIASGGAVTPTVYTIKYSDGATIDSEEHEVRRWLAIHDSPDWLLYCSYAMGAFNYLENRLTDNCFPAFHYKDNYEMWGLARFFNPSFAAQQLTVGGVDALINITPLRHHDLIDGMKTEVHAYLSVCAGVVVDTSSMHNFTESVLIFWRKFPTWGKAASIIFSMTPNTAGAERVFSLLKLMFGDSRTCVLADFIEGSLMLKYNNTKRKEEKDAARHN